MFKRKNLECDNCKREIQPNEELVVHLTLPETKKMPVGVLDKILKKHANEIYCKRCFKIISS
ncbi:hypothetical protein MHB50_20605 [Siminovitchia sp. FSL H7-0308]|uniref:hypothetical protein n=1 Tax=Siminovitchia sp. FSL H7-0308 TaxID=2921432 RepID=UPI0030EB639E